MEAAGHNYGPRKTGQEGGGRAEPGQILPVVLSPCAKRGGLKCLGGSVLTLLPDLKLINLVTVPEHSRVNHSGAEQKISLVYYTAGSELLLLSLTQRL